MGLQDSRRSPAKWRSRQVRGSSIATLLLALFLVAGGCGPGADPAPLGDTPSITTGTARTSVVAADDGDSAQPIIMTNGVWSAQGPAPMQGGGVTGITIMNGEVSGAVHAVAPHPTNPDILYVGAVNGGIWRTQSATTATPVWVPQTDALPSPSIGALEFDPTDAANMTLIAGVGRFSAYGSEGGPGGFIYRTTDSGTTWTVMNPPILQDENISGVAARGTVLLATSNAQAGGGLFRSTDTGATWTQVADAMATNGLPLGVTTDLVGVPVAGRGSWFLTAVLGSGIYISVDNGANWVNISNTPGTNNGLDAAITAAGVDNCELAVNTNGRVFCAVLANGRPIWIGYSGGDSVWTQVDLPRLPSTVPQNVEGASNAAPIVVTATDHGIPVGDKPEVEITGVTGNTNANGIWTVTRIDANSFSLDGSVGNGVFGNTGTWRFVVGANPRYKPASQGQIHFSIGADPVVGDIFYIGGDRQDDVPNGFPNYIRAQGFHGQLFRGNVTVAPTMGIPSPQWNHLTHSQMVGLMPPLVASTGGTANNSAPHADSRELKFNANGDIIQSDDGGVYRRSNPRSNAGDWFSLNGNLQITEMHDVAYDAVSNIIISGNQDNGVSTQTMTDNPMWTETVGGDGGDVKVDDTTMNDLSFRFMSSQNLGGFQWRSYNAANTLVMEMDITLTPAAGSPAVEPQFGTPLELNTLDMQRMIIGAGNGIYESMDRGANVTRIAPLVINEGEGDAIAYGGRSGGVDNMDVLYCGVGNAVYIRTAGMGTPVMSGAYPGTEDVRGIILDPDDWNRAYVCDNNTVRRTTNAGGAWEDITANLGQLTSNFHCIEYVPSANGEDAVVVGADTGVFVRVLDNTGAPTGEWARLGQNLPNLLAWDLDYDATDDVLVVGSLGRGAWKLTPVTDGRGIMLTCPQGTVPVECNMRGAGAAPGRWVGLLSGFNVAANAVDFPLDVVVNVDNTGDVVIADWVANAGMFVVPFDGLNGRPQPLAFGLHQVQVTVRSNADANRTATCTFMVDVQDTTAPVIDCQSPRDDITVAAMGALGATVTYATPIAVDNCDATVNVVCTPVSGSVFAIGTTAVTCTAVDSQGNRGTCTFNVIVTAPDIDVAPTLDFGPVVQGTTRDLPLTIRNTGTSNLEVTALTFAAISTKFTFVPPGSTLPFTIPPAGMMDVLIRYTPTTVGADAGQLTIASNDPQTPMTLVGLTGTSTATPTPNILLDPAMLAFGDVTQGTTSDLVVMVRNTGTAPLNVTALNVTGSNEFSAQTAAPFTVPAGGMTPVTVRYAPTDLGADAGTLTVVSNDPDTPMAPAALTGIGVAAPMPNIMLDPGMLAFGNVQAGLFADFALTIRNTGTAPLNVTALNLTGSNEFLLAPPAPALPFAVAAGGQMVVMVRYSPTAAGADTGTLTVVSNDPDTPMAPVALTGTGTVAPTPNIVLDPTTLAFGDVTQGTTSDLTLAVRNTGTAPLNVTALNFTTGTQFSSATAVPFMVPTGGMMNVTVRYAPTDLGPNADTLTVVSNDPDTPMAPVALSGNGVAAPTPNIAATPNPLAFGNVAPGMTRDLALTIRNTGTAALNVTGLNFTGSADFALTPPAATVPFTIQPGQMADIMVRYAPTGLGPDVGALTLASNDPDTPMLPVALTGTSNATPAPNIEATPNPLAFGSVVGGLTRDLALTIRNTGNAPLNVTALTFAGSTDFALTPPAPGLPFAIAGGATMDVMVRYAPSDIGPDNGVLSIASNDADTPMLPVVLTAAGDPPPAPNIVLEPDAIAFGDVTVATTSTRMLRVRNTGTIALNVTALNVTGSTEFNTAQGPFMVPAGSFMDVAVNYAPTNVGPDMGMLTVASNDPDEPSATAMLSGTGTAVPVPNIVVDPATLAFGEVTIGMTRDLTTAVRNTGTAPLTVTALTFVSNEFGSSTAVPFAVQPGQMQSVTVRYQPMNAGPDNSVMQVVTNDPDTPMTPVALIGTGRPVTDCNDQSTCDGELHEATVETEVFVGTAAGPLTLEAKFLDGFAYNAPLIDRVDVMWTGAFPGLQTGLQDVLTVESVQVDATGIATVRVKLVADASAFPGNSFGTMVKRIDVTINGRLNVGIANFVAAEVREGARFSWNRRCGERPPCPLPMPVPASCPERFEPRFLALSNVGLAEWLRCQAPGPQPRPAADAADPDVVRFGPSR